MLTGNYAPGFRARLYQKDLRIANETAMAHAVAVPATAVVTQLVNAMVAAGEGDRDYSALAKVLFEMAGLTEKV
jgi:2-hydroxy-3-oxopropionate reductase